MTSCVFEGPNRLSAHNKVFQWLWFLKQPGFQAWFEIKIDDVELNFDGRLPLQIGYVWPR